MAVSLSQGEFDQIIQHRYVVTEEGVAELASGLDKVQKNLSGINQASRQAETGLNRVVATASKLSSLKTGGASGMDVVANIRNQLGEADGKAGKLASTFDKLEKSGRQIRFVGVGLNQIGGALNNDLLRRAGEFALIFGTLADTASDISRIPTALSRIGNLGKLAGVGGAVAGGVVAGAGIYDAIRAPGSDDAGTIIKKGIAALQFGAVSVFEGSEKAGQALKQTSENFGLIERAAKDLTPALDNVYAGIVNALKGAVDAATEAAKTRKSAVDAFIDFQKNLDASEKKGEEERQGIIDDSNERMLTNQRDYEKRRQQVITDFAKIDKEAEQEYYADRTDRAANFDLETQRMEEDHQRAMLRLREDSELRQKDLISARDALGLARERRSYEIQRRRAEDDYQVLAGRRNADFARQIAEMEDNFRKLQDKRRADYDEQLKALSAQHVEEQKAIEDDRKEKLDALTVKLDDERQALKRSFDDRLIDLGYFTDSQRIIYNAWLQQMSDDFNAWIATNPIDFSGFMQSAIEQGQSGWYNDLHDRQSGSAASTTAAAEGVTRSRMGGMSGAGMGRGGSQNFNFYGSWSEGDKNELRNMIRRGSLETYREVAR